MKNDGLEWFTPKRFGYGAGLPMAWQGWLVLALYLAVVLGAALLFSHRPVALLAILIPSSLLFVLVAARTTRGGWRWRSGGD